MNSSYGISNALIKLPIPIIIGNTSFETTSKDEYFYLSGYLLDEDIYNGKNFLYYDNLCKNWVIAHRSFDSVNPYIERFIFPTLSSSTLSYGYVNGFSNFNGYPIINTENGDSYFYFSENLNKWCVGKLTNSVKFNNDDFNFPIYYDFCKDMAETMLGDTNSNISISGFEEDTPLIDSLSKLIPISAGQMNSFDEVISFSNKETTVFSKFYYTNSNSDYYYFKRDNSPQIISGSPCLGYYGPTTLTNPIVIGSICIGTEDLTTVPPMIGTTTRKNIQGMSYPLVFNEARHYQQNINDYHNNGYWWVATTFDKNKTRWDLYQIIDNYYPDSGRVYPFSSNNMVLISGGVDTPDSAKQLWFNTYSSSTIPIMSYNAWKTNTLTFRVFPTGSGSNLSLKIVGLTDFNAEHVKYNNNSYVSGALDTYIGNWIAPIAEFGEN